MTFKDVLDSPGVKPVLFTIFMASFGFSMILPILPFYALSLGLEPFQLGMLTASFAVMSLLFAPIMGKLADRYGRKRVMIGGMSLFIAGYLVFAFTNSLELAFLARALEGIGAAATFPSCISLLSDFTTEKQRGRAMGLMGMSWSLGFIIGPAFGGIVSASSVQHAFLASAVMAFLNAMSIAFQIKEPKEKQESKDITGKEITLLEHLKSPLLFLFLSSFMITFMIGGMDATLAIYTGEKLGFTSAQVGLIFTYIGVLIMIMQFLGGNLVNRFGELKLIGFGLGLSGLGFFLLSFTHDWVTILIPLAIFVAGNAMVNPSVSSLITKKVAGKRGAVLGLSSSFNSMGQMVGPLFGGYLYGLHHDWAFLGMALVIWAYMILFSIFAIKRLNR
jgi:multidrug resistance protein